MNCPQCGSALVEVVEEMPLSITPQQRWPRYRCPKCWKPTMFKVGKGHDGKPVYEVSSFDLARMHAGEYSRSLRRWMEEEDCWVDIFDVKGIVIASVNFFRPGAHQRPKRQS